LRNLEKIDSVLTWIEEKILVYGILFMAVILIANVISRNFFYSSINASEEISQFLVVMVTFLGTSYAARKGLHIRMSILNDFLRGKPQKMLALFVSLITACIMLYLAWLSFRYVRRVGTLHRVSPILQFPLHYVWSVVPVGFALTGVQYFLTFFRNLKSGDVWISYYVKDENLDPETAAREGEN
jgi:TRAP-type C4-dicarboxylate transport system permease small subunit